VPAGERRRDVSDKSVAFWRWCNMAAFALALTAVSMLLGYVLCVWEHGLHR
jgi:anti-sigma-K factor RskA